MKKVLIGGFLSLIGSIWSLGIIFLAGNNLVSSWDSQLGRFWSTILEMDLMAVFVLSILFIIFGIVLMVVELFRKDQ